MSRVVIVQEYVPEYRSSFFADLHRKAIQKGTDVVVAAGNPSNSQATRGDKANIDKLRIVSQYERNIFGKRVTFRDLRSAIGDADFLILEQARRNLDAYAILGRPHAKKPTALWGHGRDYTHAPGSISRAAYNWLTRQADWFFAYTEGGKDAVVSVGYPADRVTVVQNSIDTNQLTSSIAAISLNDVASFAETHDLRGKTAIFVGGIDESKRIPFLLEAAGKVSERDPEFRLLVVGAGTGDALVKNALMYCPWLKYLGPAIGEDKALALKSSQVLAMPGRVGLVAVDSFASGVPIVTTTWPWHAPEYEYLRDDVNAVVSRDSVEHYAAALFHLLNDSPRRVALSLGAVQERDKYTLDEMVNRYLEGLLRWQESPRRF